MSILPGADASNRRRSFVVVALLLAAAPVMTVNSASPRFYPDDPIWVDDDTALDASRVVPVEDVNLYDFLANTFADLADRRDVRALNVNTVDEVPDSSWFTNRIGRQELSLGEIRRGPDRVPSIALDGWQVSGGKSTGVQPGFQMIDPSGHLHQVEFDPPSNPEMATGAEIIGTAFYHAFGYHTVDVYLAELDASRLVIAPGARVWDPRLGRKRTLEQRDLRGVLRRAARQPNGKYRVSVSRYADGKPLGNFRYYQSRPDDPNDIVAHEHRRELRGARVFGAWLNHDDSRGVNSLDMLEQAGARAYVKHYMFDFGSMLGSGTVYDQRHRAGNEYLLEWKPGWLTLATLGLYTRPWMHIEYPDAPDAVGRIESKYFDPATWKPEYPNPAFDNMRADDAFWAARLVARFSHQAIRTVVEKARYTDPRSADYMTATLIERRNKVLALRLTGINPVVDFAIDEGGRLTFSNAAVAAGVATRPASYQLQWARFDNAADSSDVVGPEVTVSEPAAVAPSALLAASSFIEVRIAATHDGFPSWRKPVIVHFRKRDGAWNVVGISREPQG